LPAENANRDLSYNHPARDSLREAKKEAKKARKAGKARTERTEREAS